MKSKASSLSLRCRSCSHTKPNIKIRPGLEGYALPRKCEAEQSVGLGHWRVNCKGNSPNLKTTIFG